MEPRRARSRELTENASRTTSAFHPEGLAIDATEVDRNREAHGRPSEPSTRSGPHSGHGAQAGGRFLPGTLLAGRYRISSLVGRGAMGEVYRADDLKLGATVALKILPEAMERSPERLRLLHDEVRTARRITHPNVCRVYDVGEADGHHFLSMEYIDGEDLSALLRRIGRLPRDKAAEIGLELCQGLDAVHQQGILHRDLKPANLMIDGYGRARITDFGLAGLDGDSARGGTPGYMAPEQYLDREATVESDLYALGLVLYELFTGQRPFAADTLADLLKLHQTASPEPLSRRVEGLPPAVERMILRCLEKDPSQRPSSAREVAAALGQDAGHSWRPEPGRTIPRRPHWELEHCLGIGGFGEVWLATHSKTGERRVFKFCHELSKLAALQREITLFRFLREELGERDDIARLLDWNLEEAPFFIEAEYTAGGNLAEWAERQGGIAEVPLAVRLEIVAQASEALSAAHSVGVLHKDVKPGNVLIHDDGRGRLQVRLSDFGIGHVTDEQRLEAAGITAQGLTRTANATGTPLYRAPELWEGKPATVQADIYALGVMLYQLVVGDLRRALGSGWERDVHDELLREDIAAAVDVNPRRRLGNAVRVAERVRSLAERRLEREREARAVRDAERARAALELSRRRHIWGASALGATLLVTAALGYQWLEIGHEKDRAEAAAARARDVARVAVASEWLNRDPTRAALTLLDVERPDDTVFAVSAMRDVLSREIAVRELRGHDDWIYTAAWSPDGERILSASQDETARVWWVDGSRPPLELRGHQGIVWSAEWSADGRRAVTASEDGTARIWDVDPESDRREKPVILVGHADGENVWSASFSPRGRRVVTASADATARIWSADGYGEELVLAGHRRNVWSAEWSPDGRRIVTASADATARVWSADGEGAPIVLDGHGDEVLAASFSPNGQRVVTASRDATARVWSLDKPRSPIVLASHADVVLAASWSPDGEWVLTASRDGTARAWRVTGGVDRPAPSALAWHADWIPRARWSPDGSQIVTASRDGTAAVWSAGVEPFGLGSNQLLALEGQDGWIYDAAWSPDGSRVLTAAQDGTVRIWSTEAHKLYVLRGHDGEVLLATWSPRGDRLATAGEDGDVRVWSVDGSRPARALAGASRVRAVAWSIDGQRLLAAYEDGRVRIWGDDGPPRDLTVASGRIDHAAFSPDRNRVAMASHGGVVWVRRLSDDSRVSVLEGHQGPVHEVAWSPDSERVASASDDRTVRIWRPEGGSESGWTLVGHQLPVHGVAWSPDGSLIASASEDRTARIWSAEQARQPIVLSGHYLSVDAVAWSADGERLVTVSQDSTARIWNVDGSGEPIVLKGHNNIVRAASFSPVGERVVTTSADGTARVWSADGSGELIVLDGHSSSVGAATWSPVGERVVTTSRDGTARIWLLETADLVAALRQSTQICLDPEFRVATLGEPPAEAAARWRACEAGFGRPLGPGAD